MIIWNVDFLQRKPPRSSHPVNSRFSHCSMVMTLGYPYDVTKGIPVMGNSREIPFLRQKYRGPVTDPGPSSCLWGVQFGFYGHIDMLYTIGKLLRRSTECTCQVSNANRPANTKWKGRGQVQRKILMGELGDRMEMSIYFLKPLTLYQWPNPID